MTSSASTLARDVTPLPLDPAQKFEALKMRYEDHVELLRMMTGLDLSLFSGVMTVQLALGGWLASNPISSWAALVLVLALDFIVAFIAGVLLRNNKLRRLEAVGTLKNVMVALGFYRPGFFVDGIAINAPSTTRLWGPWYMGGVLIGYVGVVAVAVAAKLG